MKKFLFFVFAVMAFAFPAQAQVKLGISGGVLMNKVSIKGYNSENQTGWYVGPQVDIRIPLIGLSVDGAVQYAQNGVKVADESDKIQTICVPINLKKSFGLSSLASIYVAAGPQFDWNVGDKKLFSNSYSLKSSQFSINVGAGLRLFDHLQLGVAYNIPCGDTAERQIDDISFKNNTWKLGAVIFF